MHPANDWRGHLPLLLRHKHSLRGGHVRVFQQHAEIDAHETIINLVPGIHHQLAGNLRPGAAVPRHDHGPTVFIHGAGVVRSRRKVKLAHLITRQGRWINRHVRRVNRHALHFVQHGNIRQALDCRGTAIHLTRAAGIARYDIGLLVVAIFPHDFLAIAEQVIAHEWQALGIQPPRLIILTRPYAMDELKALTQLARVEGLHDPIRRFVFERLHRLPRCHFKRAVNLINNAI